MPRVTSREARGPARRHSRSPADGPLLGLVDIAYRTAAHGAEWGELLAAIAGATASSRVTLVQRDRPDDSSRPLASWAASSARAPSADPHRIHLLDDDEGTVDLALVFDADRADRRADGEALLAALRPHLARAVGMHRALRLAQATRGAASTALDGVDAPAAIVDAQAQVLCANRQFRNLGEGQGGLGSDAGGPLRCASANDTRRLRALIAEVCAAGPSSARGGEARCPDAPPEPRSPRRRGGALWLSRPAPIEARYAVTVTPLRSATLDADGVGAAILCVREPASAPATELEPELRRRFGLTAREAAVTARLLSGASIAQVAATLAITRSTARVHLRQALRKTGTHRQAELVRRVMGELPPHGAREATARSTEADRSAPDSGGPRRDRGLSSTQRT